MTIKLHHLNNTTIAEIISDSVLITSVEDAVDLIGNLYYQDIARLIVQVAHITPDFFDLKNGIAGEILQKFSNYRMQLGVVGDFSRYSGDSIRSFIYESNKNGQINFVGSVDDALSALSQG